MWSTRGPGPVAADRMGCATGAGREAGAEVAGRLSAAAEGAGAAELSQPAHSSARPMVCNHERCNTDNYCCYDEHHHMCMHNNSMSYKKLVRTATCWTPRRPKKDCSPKSTALQGMAVKAVKAASLCPVSAVRCLPCAPRVSLHQQPTSAVLLESPCLPFLQPSPAIATADDIDHGRLRPSVTCGGAACCGGARLNGGRGDNIRKTPIVDVAAAPPMQLNLLDEAVHVGIAACCAQQRQPALEFLVGHMAL